MGDCRSLWMAISCCPNPWRSRSTSPRNIRTARSIPSRSKMKREPGNGVSGRSPRSIAASISGRCMPCACRHRSAMPPCARKRSKCSPRRRFGSVAVAALEKLADPLSATPRRVPRIGAQSQVRPGNAGRDHAPHRPHQPAVSASAMKASSAPFNLGQTLGEAVALHRRGQLREAERLYARVLKAAPDHFDALNLLGAVKLQQGQYGEAQRLFAAAIKVNPRIVAAWCNLGQAQYAQKRPIDALQSFDKARTLAPDDVDILYQHANALLALDRPHDALAELETVLARKPAHFEARLNSGLAHAKLENLECALADFDSALALVPQHPVAHFNRGVVLIKLGRYDEAAAANERAVAAAPDYVAA